MPTKRFHQLLTYSRRLSKRLARMHIGDVILVKDEGAARAIARGLNIGLEVRELVDGGFAVRRFC